MESAELRSRANSCLPSAVVVSNAPTPRPGVPSKHPEEGLGTHALVSLELVPPIRKCFRSIELLVIAVAGAERARRFPTISHDTLLGQSMLLGVHVVQHELSHGKVLHPWLHCCANSSLATSCGRHMLVDRGHCLHAELLLQERNAQPMASMVLEAQVHTQPMMDVTN